MNQFINARDLDDDGDQFVVSFRHASTTDSRVPRSQRAVPTRRRGKTPVQFNGIHRRRNKKIRW